MPNPLGMLLLEYQWCSVLDSDIDSPRSWKENDDLEWWHLTIGQFGFRPFTAALRETHQFIIASDRSGFYGTQSLHSSHSSKRLWKTS